jgi:hypothetical protein
MKRFVQMSSDDLAGLLQNKYSKSTKHNDEYAGKLFADFCETKSFAYNGDKSIMAKILTEFFPSIRRKDGSSFKVGGLMTIYHSISRIVKDKHEIDIKTDPTFKNVQEMLSCVKNDMKKCGNGAIKHTEVISNPDLKKIGDISCATPELLQLKVWFSIQFHFAKRAMENSHDMEKDDLMVQEDSYGRKFVKLSDKITKNHRGNSSQESYGGIMLATDDDKCPVELIKTYMRHLCKTNKFLWQRPKLAFSINDSSYCDMEDWNKQNARLYEADMSHHGSL